MPRLMPGGAPFLLPGGGSGCLLVHGFTASPQEVRFLGDMLNQRNVTALGIRLFGHATDVRDLNRARWWDWLASVEDGIHLLRGMCDRVILAGLSLGGALCLSAAAEQAVEGVVAMSTPFRLPPDRRLQILKPVLKPLSLLMPTYPKGEHRWADPTLLPQRVDYSAYPVRGAEQVRKLLSHMRSRLGSIAAPVLLMHSHKDEMVPVGDMDQIYRQLPGPKRREWLEGGGHNLVGDADRHAVVELVSEFVIQVTT